MRTGELDDEHATVARGLDHGTHTTSLFRQLVDRLVVQTDLRQYLAPVLTSQWGRDPRLPVLGVGRQPPRGADSAEHPGDRVLVVNDGTTGHDLRVGDDLGQEVDRAHTAHRRPGAASGHGRTA